MKKIIISILFISIIYSASYACSAFTINNENKIYTGFNENWLPELPGYICENKRNVEKTSVSWNRLENDKNDKDKQIEWRSKYGSITLTCIGNQFPIIGLNEKGLFIAELFYLFTNSPSGNEKPRMFWPLWMQYIFDNYDSIETLSKGLEDLPNPDWWPSFPGSYLFITDSTGQSACLRIVGGKMKLTNISEMPVLTNGLFENYSKRLKYYKPFGGLLNIPQKDTSSVFTRFLQYSEKVANYTFTTKEDSIDYCFNALDSYFKGVWQVVVDYENLSLHIRTDLAPETKIISLEKMDFSSETPLRWLDIHKEVSGDVSEYFEPWNYEKSLSFCKNSFKNSYPNESYFKKEKSRRLIENGAKYPISYGKDL
ncbi:MAG: linear amide C-N hydrolase [Spirochaetales bacterium]|nr:linear amide C-N hydrolase [Spirochaetales bacterium]